jgi:hypothetical protein
MAIDEDISEDGPLPRDKASLLARIGSSRAALEDALERLSEAQLVAPGADGWAIKDHLIHIAAWERGIAALLRKQPRYAAMDVDRETYLRGAEAINATLYARHRDDSLDVARGTYRAAHEDIVSAIEALSDGDLFETYSHYQADEPGKDSGAPIIGWIAGNTYEHYAEHQGWIEALAASAS